jgi:oxygen-independent coproporphyrinogen-3 oxidase
MVEEAILTPAEAVDEALVMGLRLAEGVDATAIEERFGISAVDWRKVERLAASGHLTHDGGRIRLTSRGRLLLDAILGEIAAPILAAAS